MNFFILGMPRSRTAWLANFMTTGDVFCHHEGLNGCHTIDQYKDKLGTSDGDACTGLVLFDLDSQFPNAKKVIIERSDRLPRDETVDYMQFKLNEIDGLRVKFEDIDSRLEEIHTYLTDQPYDVKRADMLKMLNVQVMQPYHCDLIAARNILDPR